MAAKNGAKRNGRKPDPTAARRMITYRRNRQYSVWRMWGVKACLELTDGPGSCPYFDDPAGPKGCGYFQRIDKVTTNRVPPCAK